MKKTFFIYFLISILSFSYTEKSLKFINKEKNNDGKRWAVLIGINDYFDEDISDLSNARNDAKGIGEILEKQGQFDNVYVMTDDLNQRDDNFPNKYNVEKKINLISGLAEKNDLIVFLFSGHGITNKKGESYLITVDSRMKDKFNTAVSLKYIEEKFKNKNKTVLMIDACREEIAETKSLINEKGFYGEAEVSATFYATKQGWYSYEDEISKYGVFSNYIIEALKGAGDKNKDFLISFSELESYVQEKVSEWAAKKEKLQKPYTKLRKEKFGDLIISSYQEKENIKLENKKIEEKKMDNKINENFVFVEGGIFELGTKYERNIHSVKLDNFYMSKYEVNQKEFYKIMGFNPSKFINENNPVEYITWYDAIMYCNKLSEKEGLKPYYIMNNINKYEGQIISAIIKVNNTNAYRLPTEAEWEYAARGGTKSKNYKYSGSNEIKNIAWYAENSYATTYPSALLEENELGIYDMTGNVFEWCYDWYSREYFNKSDYENPKGPKRGYYKIFKGGAWHSPLEDCIINYRFNDSPSKRDRSLGFRIVKSENN